MADDKAEKLQEVRLVRFLFDTLEDDKIKKYPVSAEAQENWLSHRHYLSEDELSALWNNGEFVLSDLFCLYALSILGIASIENTAAFLEWYKNYSKCMGADDMIIPDTTMDYMRQAFQRLYKKGLVIKYQAESGRKNSRVKRLYQVPENGFKIMKIQLCKDVKRIGFNDFRPYSQLMGMAAAGEVGMAFLKSKYFYNFEENTIFKRLKCDTVQMCMEVITKVEEQLYYNAIDYLYFYVDKRLMTQKDLQNMVKAKVSFIVSYLNVRTVKGISQIIFACNSISDIQILGEEMLKVPELHSKLDRIFFTCAEAVELMNGDLTKSLLHIPGVEYTEDGTMRMRPVSAKIPREFI